MKKTGIGKKITGLALAAIFAVSSLAFSSSFLAADGEDLAENGLPLSSLYHQNQVMPDTWVFTDGLGRVSLTYEDVGGPRDDKTVAMMYWDWHTSDNARQGALNTTEFMKLYPDAKNNFNHSAWLGSCYYCFWNEPIYGYYQTSDEWVLRKQAELLANLGVDVVFNDHTNGNATFSEGYTAMFDVWQQARADGVASPDISFIFPFTSTTSNGSSANFAEMQLNADIYNNVYATDKYSDMWYMMDGKPLVLGSYSYFSSSTLKNFFTWRRAQSKYVADDDTNRWGWLSIYPQTLHYKNSADQTAGIVEQITVGVACNHDYVNNVITAMNGNNPMGRSYTSTYPNRYLVEGESASLYGYFFQEQFDYALEVDPSVVYITGWNEWHAWRQADTSVWATQRNVLNALVDQFNDEYSRDIEPTKGELKDHYYYLAANYIRQYKGVNPIPTPSEPESINIYGSVSQWNSVAPYYASYIGNTDDRDHNGYVFSVEGRKRWLTYTETSGRNDIIGSQVARDDDYIYFNVECASNITSYTDNLWMTLYIDIDQTNQGWETFDYVINKSAASEKTLVLERFTGNGYDSRKVADVEYNVDGRYMMVKIPKSAFGLEGDDFTINFSWTDNVHDEGDYDNYSGDIMDFYISGDVAPGGRFKYSYISGSGEYDYPEFKEEDSTDTESDSSSETESDSSSDVEEGSTTEKDTETEENTEDKTTSVDTTSNKETEPQDETTTAASSAGGGCGGSIGSVAFIVPSIGIGIYFLARRKRKRE